MEDAGLVGAMAVALLLADLIFEDQKVVSLVPLVVLILAYLDRYGGSYGHAASALPRDLHGQGSFVRTSSETHF
jgi:hypothetical protein